MKFQYEAVDGTGKKVKNTIEASSLEQAHVLLQSQGLQIAWCKQQKESIFSKEISIGPPKVKTIELTLFCRQLSALFDAGISTVKAIESITEVTPSKVMKSVLMEVTDKLKRGVQLSEALKPHPTVFNEMFISMIRSGETSGKLDAMLQELASYYERSHRISQKIKSVMIYPIILLCFSAVAVTVLMVKVIPSFQSNFEKLGSELPAITLFVVAVSEWFQQYWYVLIVFFVFLFFLPKLMRRHPRGQEVLDWVLLHIPIFGDLVAKQALLRFCNVFSSLYGAAVSITDTLPVVANATGNIWIKRVVQQSAEQVQVGQTIMPPYIQSKFFPSLVTQMMMIGEQSGTLPVMLKKSGQFYEEEIERKVERLQSTIEPFLIIFIAGIVGVIVLSILIPQLQLVQDFQQQGR
jgi:type IV pilus assembly protein PilC